MSANLPDTIMYGKKAFQNNEFDNLEDICDDCISELIILGKIKFKQRYF